MKKIAIILTVVVTCLLQSGCAWVAVAPSAISVAHGYAFGKNKSFAAPVDKVIATSAYTLNQAGFKITRIEMFNRKGLIIGQWKETHVKIVIKSVTQQMSSVIIKVNESTMLRKYSHEDEILRQVRINLENNMNDLVQVTKRFVKVHVDPEYSSPVIAYINLDKDTKFFETKDVWKRIPLMDSYDGYALIKRRN